MRVPGRAHKRPEKLADERRRRHRLVCTHGHASADVRIRRYARADATNIRHQLNDHDEHAEANGCKHGRRPRAQYRGRAMASAFVRHDGPFRKNCFTKMTAERPAILGQADGIIDEPSFSHNKNCINHNELGDETKILDESTTDRGPTAARPPLIVWARAANICRAIAAEAE